MKNTQILINGSRNLFYGFCIRVEHIPVSSYKSYYCFVPSISVESNLYKWKKRCMLQKWIKEFGTLDKLFNLSLLLMPGSQLVTIPIIKNINSHASNIRISGINNIIDIQETFLAWNLKSITKLKNCRIHANSWKKDHKSHLNDIFSLRSTSEYESEAALTWK